MRKRTLRRVLLLLAPGCFLGASCPAGTAEFLGPIIQPIISQVLSDIAANLTANLLEP